MDRDSAATVVLVEATIPERGRIVSRGPTPAGIEGARSSVDLIEALEKEKGTEMKKENFEAPGVEKATDWALVEREFAFRVLAAGRSAREAARAAVEDGQYLAAERLAGLAALAWGVVAYADRRVGMDRLAVLVAVEARALEGALERAAARESVEAARAESQMELREAVLENAAEKFVESARRAGLVE